MLTWNEYSGFSAISRQDVRVVAELEHSEVDLHLAGVRGDGGRRVAAAVELVHRPVVQSREDVAVDDQHRLGGPLQQGQAASGSQRRLLTTVRGAGVPNLRPSPQKASISSVR